MNQYFLILYLLLFFMTLSIFLGPLKNSIFSVNLKQNSYTGFLILFDYLIFIFPAVLAMLYVEPQNLWVSFNVKSEIVPYVGVVVCVQYLILLIAFYLLTKFSKYFRLPGIPLNLALDNSVAKSFLISYSTYGLILILVSIFAFGAKHALFNNFFNQEDLFVTRSQTESHAVLRYVKFASIILIPGISFLIGYVRGLSFFTKIYLISVLSFISAFGGDKSVMIYPVIIITIGYLSRPNHYFNWKSMIWLFVAFLFFGLLVFSIVTIQYPALTEIASFFNYLLQRIFVAQLIGVYEQYSLNLSDFEYIYKALPIPSSIIDFKSYHKDLMIISEDILDSDSIGVKNTLFVAEAHAIGGSVLVFFSSILFAIAFAVSFVILNLLFKNFVGSIRLATILSATTYFYFQRTTGGFTEVLLFKNALLIILALSPYLIFNLIFRQFRKIRIRVW